MKAREIMNDIIGAEFTAAHPDTVDTLKFGDGEKEVKKIATCLCATPHIIEECAKWGADLVIVHEPLYYNHTDEFTETPLTLKKRAALESWARRYTAGTIPPISEAATKSACLSWKKRDFTATLTAICD